MTHQNEITPAESFVVIIHCWNVEHTRRIVSAHPVWESERPDADINLAIVRFCTEFGTGDFTVYIETINS